MTPRHLAAEGRDLRRRVTADTTLAVAMSMNRQSILRPGDSHSPLNALLCGEEALLGSSSILGSHCATRVSFSARVFGA